MVGNAWIMKHPQAGKKIIFLSWNDSATDEFQTVDLLSRGNYKTFVSRTLLIRLALTNVSISRRIQGMAGIYCEPFADCLTLLRTQMRIG